MAIDHAKRLLQPHRTAMQSRLGIIIEPPPGATCARPAIAAAAGRKALAEETAGLLRRLTAEGRRARCPRTMAEWTKADPPRKRSTAMDENAPDEEQARPQGSEGEPREPSKPAKTAAEYAETFNKAVDVAEQVLRFAPLPAGAKRVATRAMPTVKKVAKVAPMVAPAAEPYVRKAAAKAKEAAPEVAHAAKAGAKTVASGAQTGAKAVASGAKAVVGHVRETAPKLGHAVSDGAKAAATRVHDDAPKLGRAAASKTSHLAGKLKRKSKED